MCDTFCTKEYLALVMRLKLSSALPSHAGKSSVGKSSTVNSLLGEAVARVQAFKLQADGEIVTPFVKQVRCTTQVTTDESVKTQPG